MTGARWGTGIPGTVIGRTYSMNSSLILFSSHPAKGTHTYHICRQTSQTAGKQSIPVSYLRPRIDRLVRRLLERRFEFAPFVQFGYYVTAADELTIDEHLWDRLPGAVGFERRTIGVQ